MAIRLPSYPQLDESLLLLAKWSASPFRFYYEDSDHKPLALDVRLAEDDNRSYLEDITGQWDPGTCPLYAETSINLENPAALFGKYGICCKDGVIGIGIQWYSRESRQRGSIEGMTVKCSDTSVSGKIALYFEPGQVRGDLSLEIVFYIKKAGKPNEDEKQLANTEGYLLGSPDNPAIQLRLDGSGSTFPIITEGSGKDGPLWRLYCNWDEPEYEQFDEAVTLILNRDHPAYPQVDRMSSKFNPYLLVQILAACMTQVIMTFKDNEDSWEKMLTGEDLFEGSVAQAVNYYIVSLEWNTADIIGLSESIRLYLERKMIRNESKNNKPG